MDPRGRWQALHANLRAAVTHSAAGDLEAAQRFIDAALEIDPEFAPAVSLRQTLDAQAPLAPLATGPANPRGHVPAASAVGPVAPLVSAEGWARFEQRARARRIERRLEAARTALANHQYADATAALDEVEELSPSQPELPWLREELVAARETPIRRRGRRATVGVAAVAMLLVATQIDRNPRVQARVQPKIPVVTIPSSPSTADAGAAVPAATVGSDAATPAMDSSTTLLPLQSVADAASVLSPDSVARDVGNDSRPALAAPDIPVAALTESVERTELPARPPRIDPVPPSPPTVALSAAPDVRTVPVPMAATPIERPVPSDEQQVRQILQRYRQAYASLNARSAQEVWPNVDAGALARAFGSLEFQELIFDDCHVDVTGAAAQVTCRGSTRFVPKVGARDVRTEARLWDFRLQKTASGWQIAAARVTR